MRPLFTMRRALEDPNLLGLVLAGDSWATWRAFLVAMMGEQLTDEERAVFSYFTGRAREPLQCVEEACFVVGRRGGKDQSASVLASYLAGLCEWPMLVRGERGTVMLLAPDTDQAAVQLNRIKANFEASPLLREQVVNSTRDTLSLQHRDDDGRPIADIDVVVQAANHRRLRGRTCISVICTESAFWYDAETSANPDFEIVDAARPALLTTRGPMIFISSPRARRGVMWNTYKKHYGPDGNPKILVVQGATGDFNPVERNSSIIARAYEDDPASAAAEYGASFRSDLEAYVSREAVEACVVDGVRELPPAPGVQYRAFCDPAGGTGGDSFTMAIAHKEKDVRVLDCLREFRPPFNPSEVIADLARTLKNYHVSRVFGDRWAGGFPPEQFAKHVVSYEQSAAPKSNLYRDALPMINTGKVRLLDSPRLVAQLCSLERRTGRGSGRDVIDHPPKGHDDVSNACAGALVLLGGTSSAYTEGLMGATSGVAALANEMAFYQRLGRPW